MAERRRGSLRGPTDLPGKAWVAALQRGQKEFRRRNMTDAAAALTYYGVLAIFPTLLALVALLGVFGQYPATVNAVMQVVRQIAPPATVRTLHGTLDGIVRDKGGAGALLGLGALGALWSSSSYIGAFARACNRIYCIEEGRPTVKLRASQLLIATVMVATMAFVAIAYLFTGKLAHSAGSVIGLSGTVVTVWQIAKWPTMALIAAIMLSVLYYASPNVRQARFRWITPGGVLALSTLVLTSTGFAFYVSNFGSYNKTYGALGGVIVMLVWLWIANVTLLLGVQVNAELERSRRAELGEQVEHPPFVEPKDTRKMARA